MFYDDAFARITASSAFSEKAVLTIGTNEYDLYGFFYSGNYGEKKMDKGYSVAKTVKRQSFETAKANLPTGVEVTDLARKSLLVRGVDFTIREVVGNDSGMLVMDLVPTGGAS